MTLIFTLLSMAKIVPTKAWLIGGAVVCLIAALGYYGHVMGERGRQQALEAIERANNASENKATVGGDAAGRAYDDCIARHGSWNRAQLVCDGGTGK